MTSSKEEFIKKERLLGDHLNAVLKGIESDVTAIKNLGKETSSFFESLVKLDEIKKKEFLQYRIDFKKFFLAQIQQSEDHRQQLVFIYEQLSDLQLKIEDAKAHNEPFKKDCYQNILDNIVLPFKSQLIELVRLENKVGPLKKVEEVTVADCNEVVKESFPAHNPIIKKDSQEKEIFIPLVIKDKPLQTQTGKPLNNADYIAAGRKFTWNDDRIPDLIVVFLQERKRIFDYQLRLAQDFFKNTRCNGKIVFDGNANILITILYDLVSNGYLKVSADFLAERLELAFVKKVDTSHPLISKNSAKAGLKPTNVSRRLKPGAINYPDILKWLQEKLVVQQ